MEEIYIILLNYNGFRDTIECIKSIKENEHEIKYKMIVVDNQSTDESVERLKEIEEIILIRSDKNNGFSYGNNLGIQYAIEQGAKYILLLNNDTVITKNCISMMYQEMQKHQDLGIIGSRIMFYDDKNKINYISGRVNWQKGIAEIDRKGKEYQDTNIDFQYTQFITGCCMLIKREVIEKVGYLPEEYFMYYEDVDYCVQVMQHGYKLGVCLNSVIYHKESASTGGGKSPFAIKWNTRNRIIFINKYIPKKWTTKIFFYTTRLIVGANYLIRGQRKEFTALVEGIKEGKNACKGVKKK